ncbi:hypothetical protein B481_0030 [Planococcus halocryophilus Or1]|nr:hypothetical protein B481_0030 [Planococcus halocryophilus Or1]
MKIAAEVGPNRHHLELWETHIYVIDGVDIQGLKTLDQETLQEKLDELAKATNQHSYNIAREKGN